VAKAYSEGCHLAKSKKPLLLFMVSVLDGSGHAIFSIQMHNAEAAEQGASNLYFVG
jgi:hypothetical protein